MNATSSSVCCPELIKRIPLYVCVCIFKGVSCAAYKRTQLPIILRYCGMFNSLVIAIISRDVIHGMILISYLYADIYIKGFHIDISLDEYL